MLSAAGSKASVLKGYLGSATHWLSQVLVLSLSWADKLCVNPRPLTHPHLVLFLNPLEKLLCVHFRCIQSLPDVNPPISIICASQRGSALLKVFQSNRLLFLRRRNHPWVPLTWRTFSFFSFFLKLCDPRYRSCSIM